MRYLMVLLSVSLLASTSALQADNKRTNALLTFARDKAMTAGGARYCKMDPVLVEEYIVKAHAQIAVQADDDYEKVMGRMEFNNILAAASVLKPEIPCETVVRSVKDLLRAN